MAPLPVACTSMFARLFFPIRIARHSWARRQPLPTASINASCRRVGAADFDVSFYSASRSSAPERPWWWHKRPAGAPPRGQHVEARDRQADLRRRVRGVPRSATGKDSRRIWRALSVRPRFRISAIVRPRLPNQTSSGAPSSPTADRRGPSRTIMPSFKDLLTPGSDRQGRRSPSQFLHRGGVAPGQLELPAPDDHREGVSRKTRRCSRGPSTPTERLASPPRSFYEHRIGASAMVEIAIPYTFTHEAGDWGASFGDLALGYKQKLFHSLKKGSIFSVGRRDHRPHRQHGARHRRGVHRLRSVRHLRATAARRQLSAGAHGRRTARSPRRPSQGLLPSNRDRQDVQHGRRTRPPMVADG